MLSKSVPYEQAAVALLYAGGAWGSHRNYDLKGEEQISALDLICPEYHILPLLLACPQKLYEMVSLEKFISLK